MAKAPHQAPQSPEYQRGYRDGWFGSKSNMGQNAEYDSGYSAGQEAKNSKTSASEYRVGDINQDSNGVTIAFHLGNDSAPAVHCRLTNEDLAKIHQLPPNGGVYSFRDEQGLNWEASHDGRMLHLVCQSPSHSSANGFVDFDKVDPVIEKKDFMVTDSQLGGKRQPRSSSLKLAEPEIDLMKLVPGLDKGRKITSWEEAPGVDFDTLPQNVRQAIQELPIEEAPMAVWKHPMAESDIYNGKHYLVVDQAPVSEPKPKYFLVYTGGYNYARHVVQLENFNPFMEEKESSECQHESLNNEGKCMQCGRQFTPEEYNAFVGVPEEKEAASGPAAKMKIYDDGGKTIDRYTIVFMDQPESNGTFAAIGAGSDVTSPQGFWQHTTAQPGEHLGQEISFEQLPKPLQNRLAQEASTDPTEQHASLEKAAEENDKAVRPFEKTDWYGWAGAERFSDGSEPLIGYTKVQGWPEIDTHDFEGEPKKLEEVTIIVDAGGVSINGSGSYGDYMHLPSKGKEQDIALANQLLQQTPLTYEWLQQNNFEGTFMDEATALQERDKNREREWANNNPSLAPGFGHEGAAEDPDPDARTRYQYQPGEVGVFADHRDIDGLIESFRSALSRLGITMREHPQTEGSDTYGFILSHGSDDDPVDATPFDEEAGPSSYQYKPGEVAVQADWRDIDGLVESFRSALSRLGITMREHPEAEGSDTYGFILSRGPAKTADATQSMPDPTKAPQKPKEATSTETVLYGLPKGATERYDEVLLLTNATPEKIEEVKVLAAKDGFHSFRVAKIDLSQPPNFGNVLQ